MSRSRVEWAISERRVSCRREKRDFGKVGYFTQELKADRDSGPSHRLRSGKSTLYPISSTHLINSPITSSYHFSSLHFINI
jgi:hypothetical protein